MNQSPCGATGRQQSHQGKGHRWELCGRTTADKVVPGDSLKIQGWHFADARGLVFKRWRQKKRLRLWLKYKRCKDRGSTQITGNIYPRGQNTLLKNNLQRKTVMSYLKPCSNVTLMSEREIAQDSLGFTVFLLKLKATKFFNRNQGKKVTFFPISLILLVNVELQNLGRIFWKEKRKFKATHLDHIRSKLQPPSLSIKDIKAAFLYDFIQRKMMFHPIAPLWSCHRFRKVWKRRRFSQSHWTEQNVSVKWGH